MRRLSWFLSLLLAVPALAGPYSKQLEDQFAAIEREIGRLEKANQPAQAKGLAEKLQFFRDRVVGKAKPDNQEPKLHVIGVHEARGANQRQQRFGDASVEITATDQPIILALCAYNSVTWHLKIADGVKLQKVILGGYYEQELAEPLKNIPVDIHTRETKNPPWFYACKMDDESFPDAAKALKQLTDQSIFSFQGIYTPQQPFVIGPANTEWLSQCVLHEIEPLYLEATAYERSRQRDALRPIRFQAMELTRANVFGFSARLCDFSALGRIAGESQELPGGTQHMAIDPAGPTHYIVSSQSVYQVDLKNGQKKELQINNRNIPRLSWTCGLTFDTKRNLLILASLGGEGFLYAYSPQQNQWSLIHSLNNVDLQALTYSSEEDCYFGLSSSFGGDRWPQLYRYNEKGTLINKVPIVASLPPTRRGANAGFQLISTGRKLALLTPPEPNIANPDQPNITRCFLIDPGSGQVTYSGTLTPQPAPKPAALTPAELDQLWTSLRDEKTKPADDTMWKLASASDAAVTFIRAKFPPLAQARPEKISKIIARLDDENFQTREEAAAELTRMGKSISTELQALRARDLPASTRTYIDVILRQIEETTLNDTTPEDADPQIRLESRAITTLARIGTPGAVEVLQQLASGPPGLPRTTAAKAALRHLGRE